MKVMNSLHHSTFYYILIYFHGVYHFAHTFLYLLGQKQTRAGIRAKDVRTVSLALTIRP